MVFYLLIIVVSIDDKDERIVEQEQRIRELELRLRAEQEQKECGLCFENPRSHAFFPCGHTICGVCSVRYSNPRLSERVHTNHCPSCRADFVAIIQIYGT